MSYVPIRALGAIGPQNGEVVRIDGFPGRCRTLHSVSAKSNGYIGEVLIEASLSPDPQDDDWVVVERLVFINGNQTVGANISGKFSWIRVLRHDDVQGEVVSAIVR